MAPPPAPQQPRRRRDRLLSLLGGLALAPDQFDFTTNANSGTQLVNSSGIFYHGANLGLEARW